MAAVTSISFTAVVQSPDLNSSARSYSNLDAFKLRTTVSYDSCSFRASSSSRMVVHCMSTAHLMKYKKSFQYDHVFALGFVTVYDRLMEGADAQKLEEWAKTQSPSSLVEFASKDGEIEGILKDIAERAGSKGNFSYSRFFAVGLFRLLELANATEPTILDKLCAALNVNKKNVDRDLDIYRNLLSKLVQAKELLKEYVDREKKKTEERAASQKASEAITKCLGEHQSAWQ
ncbi:photosystem II reaction center PSB29 protein [Perilla frutescens var. hirtella]|nr:photosystem II reaction center PSB29 protein [Perilla frutescens var. hirtella]